MGRRSKFIVAAIVIGALSLGLTACSSKDGGSSSATTTSSPASSSAKWKGAARSTTPMSATDKAAIDTIANEALKQLPGLPGLWVGVWDPKKGVYVTAYGSAVDPDQKATTEDHSRIGSVTKTFTATAVLQQVEAGKLSLDDTIGDVLPDLAAEHPAVGKITVQQLLGMTSGIPDYANTGLVLNKVVQDPTKVWTPEEIIDLTLTESKLSAPGTPGYSTTNYLILGQMVEKVSGISIEQAIGKVAKAAGLKNSALTEPSDNALPAPSSHGYLNEPGVESLAGAGVTAKPVGDVTDWSASWGGAGGSMYSTIEDLGTWASTGLGSSLLSKSTVAERLKATKVPNVGSYGLGIIKVGKDWVGHTGQIIGWEADAFYNTKTGATVVAIVNETGSGLAALAVIGQLYPDLAAGLL